MLIDSVVPSMLSGVLQYAGLFCSGIDTTANDLPLHMTQKWMNSVAATCDFLGISELEACEISMHIN